MRKTWGVVLACVSFLALSSGGANPLQAQGPKRSLKWRATLVLYSRPVGKIAIDDSIVGETPKSVSIPAGTHKIRISRDGYLPWERLIAIEGGETLRVTDIVLVRDTVLKERPRQGS